MDLALDIFSLRVGIVAPGALDFAEAARLLSKVHAAASMREFCIPTDLRWAIKFCAPHQIPTGAVAVLGTDQKADT